MRPHDHDAHDLAIEEQRGQVVGLEALESRPQPEVGVQRQLRLQADEVLDGVEDRHVVPLEQQLPVERRPVQRPVAQHVDHPVDAAR